MLKKGEKYKIISWTSKRPHHWNNEGLMDKWRGKLVTIRDVYGAGGVIIEEDHGERQSGTGWWWKITDFEGVDFSDDPNLAFIQKKRS